MQRLDHVRAVLDDLMGHNRDGDMADYEIRTFEDRRVCKPHLLGLCVHDRFFNTTLDQGACPSEACGEAADKFRKQYLAWRGSGPDRWEYVREQLAMMDAFIAIVDRGIERNQRRTETAQGYRPETVDLDAHPEVLEVAARIDSAVKEAEAAGEEGRVDESQRLMDEAERLKTEKLVLQRRILGTAPRGQVGNGHLLQACSACGAMLSERDSDDRLREHFEGRMHRGVVDGGGYQRGAR